MTRGNTSKVSTDGGVAIGQTSTCRWASLRISLSSLHIGNGVTHIQNTHDRNNMHNPTRPPRSPVVEKEFNRIIGTDRVKALREELRERQSRKFTQINFAITIVSRGDFFKT